MLEQVWHTPGAHSPMTAVRRRGAQGVPAVLRVAPRCAPRVTSMSWDDELDRLAAYVRTHFGERELNAAGGRAMAALKPSDLAGTTEEDDEVIASPHGELYDIDAYHEALRRELRRLVTPQ